VIIFDISCEAYFSREVFALENCYLFQPCVSAKQLGIADRGLVWMADLFTASWFRYSDGVLPAILLKVAANEVGLSKPTC
jgi:hypothetical protein